MLNLTNIICLLWTPYILDLTFFKSFVNLNQCEELHIKQTRREKSRLTKEISKKLIIHITQVLFPLWKTPAQGFDRNAITMINVGSNLQNKYFAAGQLFRNTTTSQRYSRRSCCRVQSSFLLWGKRSMLALPNTWDILDSAALK